MGKKMAKDINILVTVVNITVKYVTNNMKK